LDELLAHVDEALEYKPAGVSSSRQLPRSTASQSGSAAPAPTRRAQPRGTMDEIDALLEEAEALTRVSDEEGAGGSGWKRSSAVPRRAAPTAGPSGQRASVSRCFPLRVGGTGCTLGLCTPVRKETVCDNLRCTKCDFRVMRFPDREWTDAVDYMFFRNNVPDEERLSKQLRPRRGCAAYCCQCCWVSVVDAEVIAVGSQLDRWVCGGCSHR